MDFLSSLSSGAVIADGSPASLLRAQGISSDRCTEALCLDEPEHVEAVHRAFLDAGAQVISTHTFGANGPALKSHGLDGHVNELNWTAAKLARDATAGSGAWVAGIVGPLASSVSAKEWAGVFQEQLGALLDGGAQLIILPTFTELAPLLVALEQKHTLHHCPVICSVTPGPKGILADGTPLRDAWKKLRDGGADLVGINCLSPSETRSFYPRGEEGVAAFPSAGIPDAQGNHPVGPDAFTKDCLALIDSGVHLVGGCCGVLPHHIAALRSALDARAQGQ